MMRATEKALKKLQRLMQKGREGSRGEGA